MRRIVLVPAALTALILPVGAVLPAAAQPTDPGPAAGLVAAEPAPDGEQPPPYTVNLDRQRLRKAQMESSWSQSGRAAGARNPGRLGFDDITWEECEENPSAATDAGWIKNRYSFCQRMNWKAEIRARLSGPRVGWIKYRTTLIGSGDNGFRHVQYTVRVDRIETSVSSNYPSGKRILEDSSLSIGLQCQSAQGTAQHCRPQGEPTAIRPVRVWRLNPTAVFEFDSEAAGLYREKLAFSEFRQEWRAHPPDGTPVGSGLGPVHEVRWDSAPYLKGSGGGIFNPKRPIVTFDARNAQYQQVAWHIFNALYHPSTTFPRWPEGGKTIPGDADSRDREPLSRTTDPLIQSANAATARPVCQQITPDYAQRGLECDQFPFASTLEGAALGDRRYSACPVKAEHRAEADDLLRSWYYADRVLDTLDPFNVQVKGVPPQAAVGRCPAPAD